MAVMFTTISAISIYSDIKCGVIPNRLLFLGGLVASILDFILYFFFLRDISKEFLICTVMVILLSLQLFCMHYFAGGDSKLAIVLALFYPADCYFSISVFHYSLIIAICFAIFWGYVYLFFSAVISLLRRKIVIPCNYFAEYLKNYLLQTFMLVLLYISLLNLILLGLNRYIEKISPLIALMLCLVVSFLVGRVKFLKKTQVWSTALIMVIFLSVFFQQLPFSLNFVNYLFSFLLVLCQMTIRPTLYKNVEVNNLKSGMILSMETSLMMQNSRLHGLPAVSKEDLSSRLTEEEVTCVRKWARNRKIKTVSIVRKIPFAIFLVMGYISYFVIWCAVR